MCSESTGSLLNDKSKQIAAPTPGHIQWIRAAFDKKGAATNVQPVFDHLVQALQRLHYEIMPAGNAKLYNWEHFMACNPKEAHRSFGSVNRLFCVFGRRFGGWKSHNNRSGLRSL